MLTYTCNTVQTANVFLTLKPSETVFKIQVHDQRRVLRTKSDFELMATRSEIYCVSALKA